MRNVSDKKVVGKNQNTRFMFTSVFYPEILAVYKIMWKDVVEPERSEVAI
jgi:hypothetical protein